MKLVAASTGLLPPSGETTDPDEIRQAAVRLQLDAGLDTVAAGQTDWETLLAHPLSVHPATRPGDPRPYLDTARTYRPPVVTGDLGDDGATAADRQATVAAELDAAAAALESVGENPGDRLQAVLSGPYTLAALARDDHYGDRDEFLDAVAAFLAAEIQQFPELATLWLLEPALVSAPPADGLDERASAAIDRVTRATAVPVVVHAPGGAMTEKVHAHLLDADVTAVGYDFVADHEANRSLVAEFGTKRDLALGLVDARDPAVESAETVRERIDWVLDALPPAMAFDTVSVAPNDGLFRLPPDAVVGKLRALAGGVERWRAVE